MMGIHRRLFLGAVTAALGLLASGRSFASSGITVRPGFIPLKDVIAKRQAERAASPACHLFNTRKRGIDGMSHERHPPVYGNGEDDDYPGLSASLADRGHVDLPAHRLYRLSKPLSGDGWVSLVDPGFARAGTSIDPDLTRPLREGDVRYFYMDKVEWGGFEIVVVDA
jgi:hypothetical protein